MRRRILVLHSGGMDSTVCLYAAHRAGHEVISLGVDYGQRLAVEMTFAEQQAAAIGARREVVRVQWEKPQRKIPLDRDIEEMPSSISPAFLPGRNIVFLSLAAAHAAGLHADEIHIGLNCVDFSGYPDCTIEFFESFRNMLAIASPGGASLQAPLLRMSKRQIALLARELGLGEWDTWSCYRPQRVNGTIAPCHHCDACKLHAHAWAGL
ncbi:7-cyano-7-deazaguanine synthase QueC [Bradyrhizobium sp. LVM 105]|uniref:7-cyano-7-deazaguanine synthase n=1 Tax=Bradyrhizobium frederickii TaxID=2560054 RepID=A0A4Y9NTB6_9BRAD|nr:7-cyano-7-deazaguanine synthase QueC [Bradyrhizobium frederickii]RTE90979.1 7-cyano-7-deazaguanine synthase QueC [Bradyrhizobium sp. LVM 105]TFV35272.1 7-cyano-7-deazaguanine synthase QueC [Bradyrhizobium frederickii]TFV69525.1 7-cyano-7-deazaguanine synthase QueC [Bradyrhizobium frederickii]